MSQQKSPFSCHIHASMLHTTAIIYNSATRTGWVLAQTEDFKEELWLGS